MSVTLTELRKLFYVKIPERLFYGMTRDLKNGQMVKIFVDDNQEYETLEVYRKLSEQMNAHSAYRKKGYKVNLVEPKKSDESIPLQIIDVFMGVVVYILEKQYKKIGTKENDICLQVKSDLIYRFLIENGNIEMVQNKINLFKWEGEDEEIQKINLSEYISEFIVDKTRFDIGEMIRLEKIRNATPGESTKFYRLAMEYKNSQLRTLQGYIDELDGKGRNSFLISL